MNLDEILENEIIKIKTASDIAFSKKDYILGKKLSQILLKFLKTKIDLLGINSWDSAPTSTQQNYDGAPTYGTCDDCGAPGSSSLPGATSDGAYGTCYGDSPETILFNALKSTSFV